MADAYRVMRHQLPLLFHGLPQGFFECKHLRLRAREVLAWCISHDMVVVVGIMGMCVW